MRVFPIVKKVVGAAVGGTNFVVFVKPGLRAVTVVSGRFATVKPGLSAAVAPIRLVTREAVGLVQSHTVSGTAIVTPRAGLSAANKTSGSSSKPDQRGAAKVTQITYNLTRRVGGNFVTENAVAGRTDWTNDTNAISGTNGKHDGSSASIAGNATGARGGQLALAYPGYTNKTPLTITSVKLYFYWAITFAAADTGSSGKLEYSTSSGGVVLKTVARSVGSPGTPSENHLTSPDVFDITAAIGGDWTKLASLAAYCTASIQIAQTGTSLQLDAIELEVIASTTDTF